MVKFTKCTFRSARKKNVSGKVTKDPAGHANHNDREFYEQEWISKGKLTDSGIDLSKSHLNVYLGYEDEIFTPTKDYRLQAYEDDLYKELYEPHLKHQNAKHEKNRQYKRVKTIDEYKRTRKNEINETLLQVGNSEDGDYKAICLANGLTEEQARLRFVELVKRFNQKQREMWGDELKIYNTSIHFDETSFHAHQRSNLAYINANGLLEIDHTKILKAKGLQDMTKRENAKDWARYNNVSITFTEINRKLWEDLVDEDLKEFDYQVNRIRDNSGRNHLSVSEFKRVKEIERDQSEYTEVLVQIQQEQEQKQQELNEQQQLLVERESLLNADRQKLIIERKLLDDEREELDKRNKRLDDFENGLNTSFNVLNERTNELFETYINEKDKRVIRYLKSSNLYDKVYNSTIAYEKKNNIYVPDNPTISSVYNMSATNKKKEDKSNDGYEFP